MWIPTQKSLEALRDHKSLMSGLAYPVHKGSGTQEEQQQSRQAESAPDKQG